MRRAHAHARSRECRPPLSEKVPNFEGHEEEAGRRRGERGPFGGRRERKGTLARTRVPKGGGGGEEERAREEEHGRDHAFRGIPLGGGATGGGLKHAAGT